MYVPKTSSAFYQVISYPVLTMMKKKNSSPALTTPSQMQAPNASRSQSRRDQTQDLVSRKSSSTKTLTPHQENPNNRRRSPLKSSPSPQIRKAIRPIHLWARFPQAEVPQCRYTNLTWTCPRVVVPLCRLPTKLLRGLRLR